MTPEDVNFDLNQRCARLERELHNAEKRIDQLAHEFADLLRRVVEIADAECSWCGVYHNPDTKCVGLEVPSS